MGTRVFLTGISGYLGNVLVTHLANLSEVDSITGVYNTTTPQLPIHSKVKLVKTDIRSPDLAAAMVGHEVVVHTAFIVQWLAKMSARVRDDINFNGIRNVATAAVRNQVRCFIHASSVAAYAPDLASRKDDVSEELPIGKGDSLMYYLNGKAVAEKELVEVLDSSAITLTIFRPCFIVGPHDRTTVRSFRENAAKLPGHNPRLQFVHEDDVAAAFVQAIHTNMPGTYNVTPDDFMRISDVYDAIGLKFIPTVPLWLAHMIMSMRWQYFGSPVHPSWLDATLVDATFSNTKLKATGWRPLYNSAQALRVAMCGVR